MHPCRWLQAGVTGDGGSVFSTGSKQHLGSAFSTGTVDCEDRACGDRGFAFRTGSEHISESCAHESRDSTFTRFVIMSFEVEKFDVLCWVWRCGFEVENLGVLCWGLAGWFACENIDVLCWVSAVWF